MARGRPHEWAAERQEQRATEVYSAAMARVAGAAAVGTLPNVVRMRAGTSTEPVAPDGTSKHGEAQAASRPA